HVAGVDAEAARRRQQRFAGIDADDLRPGRRDPRRQPAVAAAEVEDPLAGRGRQPAEDGLAEVGDEPGVGVVALRRPGLRRLPGGDVGSCRHCPRIVYSSAWAGGVGDVAGPEPESNMKLRTSAHRSSAPWVWNITSPSASTSSLPPGSMPMYCSPSRPAEVILAELSAGSFTYGSMVMVSTAWKLSGSSRWSVTVPILIPDILTSLPRVIPLTLSTSAMTR